MNNITIDIKRVFSNVPLNVLKNSKCFRKSPTSIKQSERSISVNKIERKLNISDKVVNDLAKKIREVKMEKTGKLYYVDNTDAKDLKRYRIITTYHRYSASQYFNPTPKEVLAQIPKRYRNKACAFKICCTDSAGNNILTTNNIVQNGKFHVVRTILYKKIS